MKVSELQIVFIKELKASFSEWKFIKSQRHFKKAGENTIWYIDIGYINHAEDFDVVGSVAVEFKAGRDRVCIVGAEMGNIEGSGQYRFPVSNIIEAKSSAQKFQKYFKTHGLPFLRQYSDPINVITTLNNGGKEAILISPFINQHQNQINKLKSYCDVSI